MRAFADKKYDYYELTQSLGFDGRDYMLPDGSIFYHDKDDDVKGSIGDGCLKLCWTPDGNCYGRIAGDCMAFHASFKDTDLFKLVQRKEDGIDVIAKECLKETIKNLESALNKTIEAITYLKNKL